jgi:prepilin-type N-terminal cleavage/methylation domain-containing protein/prepilin-type processing-associated H-X9-DG protein
MPQPRRSARGFTLVELLVVIAIISLLMAILLPVLGRASKAARSTRCKATLAQMFKGLRLYFGTFDEYLPLAWHVGGSGINARLGNLTFARFVIQENCVNGFHHAISDRDIELANNSVSEATKVKFGECQRFWSCADKGWTRDYFAPVLIFKWPGYTHGPDRAGSDLTTPYDKHRQLGELTRDVADSRRPVLADVNASLPDAEATDPDSTSHETEMQKGFGCRTVDSIDAFVGVGESLRDQALKDWETTRFDFRHNDAINVLYLDGHVTGAKRTNRPLMTRIHYRWNSLTIRTEGK